MKILKCEYTIFAYIRCENNSDPKKAETSKKYIEFVNSLGVLDSEIYDRLKTVNYPRFLNVFKKTEEILKTTKWYNEDDLENLETVSQFNIKLPNGKINISVLKDSITFGGSYFHNIFKQFQYDEIELYFKELNDFVEGLKVFDK